MSSSTAADESTTYWCDVVVVDGSAVERVAITVADGRIRSVTPGADRAAGSTHLAGLTVAGFANAHSHAFHRALRGRTQGDSGSFWTWRDVMYRAAERLDPDRYFRLARATFGEMALAGVATVGEFHYVHHLPDGAPYANPNAMGEALLAAADEAGLRITLLDTLYLHGGFATTRTAYSAPTGVQVRYTDGSAERWAERVDLMQAGPTHRIGAAIHSVRAVDPASMSVVATWADDRSAPVHAHVSEQHTENEQCLAVHGSTPTTVFADAGLAGDRFTAVHATHLSDHDIEQLGLDGFVCVCPTTERDLGDGIGPTRALVAAGARLCLGTDSHAMIDLLEEARAVELDERLGSLQRGAHRATSLLEMATQNGHSSLGWHDAGTIAVGNHADLTTITLDSVRTAGAPTHQAVESAVFAATASDVTNVIIGGNLVVADGAHRRFDVAAELQRSITDLFA
ncbi:MAG TPA: formimidoylglutamate deiminase [Ilumatobacter sp.]|nr:formimidoylglutamate deiminase [Ilumatobacter sp.]